MKKKQRIATHSETVAHHQHSLSSFYDNVRFFALVFLSAASLLISYFQKQVENDPGFDHAHPAPQLSKDTLRLASDLESLLFNHILKNSDLVDEAHRRLQTARQNVKQSPKNLHQFNTSRLIHKSVKRNYCALGSFRY